MRIEVYNPACKSELQLKDLAEGDIFRFTGYRTLHIAKPRGTSTTIRGFTSLINGNTDSADPNVSVELVPGAFVENYPEEDES